jgi:hypothetical protein
MNVMDSIVELIFEPLYNRIELKIKQFKARLIYKTYSKKNNWINRSIDNKTYREIILSNEILLDLFLDKEYRNNNLKEEQTRIAYIKNIKKVVQK